MVTLWIPKPRVKHRKIKRSTVPKKPPYWKIGDRVNQCAHNTLHWAMTKTEGMLWTALRNVTFLWYHVAEVVLKWAITTHKHRRATRSKAGTTTRHFRLRGIPVTMGKRKRLLMILAITMAAATRSAAVLTTENSEVGTNEKGAVCMTASHAGATAHAFDTDSIPIQLDNGATRTMSFARSDFVTGTLKPLKVPRSVMGYGGTRSPITHEGTIRWSILDDTGHTRSIQIPNSLYVPTSRSRLLSPQHMAQEADDNYPRRRGTWCATYDSEIVLHWNQGRHTLTTPLDKKGTNVGTAWTSPGYQRHNKYCQKTGEQAYFTTMSPHPIRFREERVRFADEGEDNEQAEVDAAPEGAMVQKGAIIERGEQQVQVSTIREGPVTTAFELDGPTPETTTIQARDAEDEYEYLKDSRELLMWHTKMSHISQNRLQRMAKMGHLPKRLATCPVLKCQACEFGKATKRPWRTKATATGKSSHTLPVTAPGHCVSVDQLESRLPGLIGQMKGRLVTKRYRVATVFVDQYSGLSNVHLQVSTTAAETLEAKVEFERYAASFGVKIRHYHADNGRFADNEWRKHVSESGQRLTFCGVGAHHQNGIAEKRIRDIQDLARTSLIYANRRWPQAVDARLWPYALRNANNVINKTVFPTKTKSPIEIFSATDIMPNLTQDHPFGCPTYALDGRLRRER